MSWMSTEDFFNQIQNFLSDSYGSYNSRDFYKELYHSLLWELWNTGTSKTLQRRINDSYTHHNNGSLLLYAVEWQVYKDLYQKCKENNGRLPLPNEAVTIPIKITLGNEIIDLDKVRYSSLIKVGIRKVEETINYIFDAASRHIRETSQGQATREKHRISIQTKEDNKPQDKEKTETGANSTDAYKEEISRHLEQARNDAEEIRKRAEDDAARIRCEANEESEKKAQEVSRDLVRKYMVSELNNNWAGLRQTIETEDAYWQENLTRGEQEREKIWARVSGMQGDLVKAMEEAVADITRIKQDLCQELGDWRSSLYVNQFDDMTRVYTGLFRLHDELNKVFSITTTTEMPEENKKEIAEGVERLTTSLGVLERQMDRTLAVFGLYSIRPAENDFFDPESHELTDKQQEDGILNGEGYRIMRCVTPGVALKYNEALREDKILRKAKVEVNPQSKS